MTIIQKGELMGDLISRQAAIDALDEQIALCDKALKSFGISMRDEYAVKVERASLVAFRETLEYMPSAQPQRMRGRWIKSDTDGFVCSVCRNGYKMQPTIMGEPMFEFCPCCGADMRGGEQNG